ncbi:MAG: hypothetical protein JSR37_06800 [Verrucomicrobia bacterium]|nr:hypothetical protein [Verrucomicrobiota bacterium]MBS0637984.1 hypothetical protein [Verrucomicrobiota bacterium]
MTLSKLTCAFALAKDPNLYIALHESSGLTVKRDEAQKASIEQIFKRVACVVADSLTADKRESYEHCVALQKELMHHGVKHPAQKQAAALVELAVCKAMGELLHSNPQAVTQLLKNALKNLASHFGYESEREKLFPKGFFDKLRYQLLTVLNSKFTNYAESNILFDLDGCIHEITVAWWEAKAARRKPCEKPPIRHLSYTRDLLYGERVLLQHVVGYATAVYLTEQKITKLQTQVEKLYYQNQALLFDIDEDELGLVEIGLLVQLKQACLRMQRSGIDESTSKLVKKLVSYKEDPTHIPLFYDLAIELLKINELIYKAKTLADDTEMLLGLGVSLIQEKESLSSLSYLVRKRVKFLTNMVKDLDRDLKAPATYCLQESVEREAQAARIVATIRTLFKKFIKVSDHLLYRELHQKIASRRVEQGNKIDTFCRHERLAYTNLNKNQEYIWAEIAPKNYEDFNDAIAKKLARVLLRITIFVQDAKKPQPERSFLPALPPAPTVVALKKTKKKAESQQKTKRPSTPKSVESRSPSPLSLPLVPPVEQPVLASKALPAQLQIAKPLPVVVLQTSPLPRYAERVSDWFSAIGSERDPFIKDPKYRDGAYSAEQQTRIRMYHNFGLAVDRCLSEAEETTDEEVLKLYKAKRRLQLVVELVRKDFFTKGVITLSFGHSGKVFHRWFTPKNSRELVNPGVHDGWKVLNEEEDPLEHVEYDDSEMDDGSYIESVTPNTITVADPKNTLTIRIARLA